MEELLLPAEGEGRNALFAASIGWDVTAFDSSIEAKRKAELLAKNKNVSIKYLVADFENFEADENFFDCIALIFAHTPEETRKHVHPKLINYLKPGGVLILEGFSKKQINFNSGGPKNIEMLFSKETLLDDFSMLHEIALEEKEVELSEGDYHNGKASVISLVGYK